MTMRRVIHCIATSLDGGIAHADGGVGRFPEEGGVPVLPSDIVPPTYDVR